MTRFFFLFMISLSLLGWQQPVAQAAIGISCLNPFKPFRTVVHSYSRLGTQLVDFAHKNYDRVIIGPRGYTQWTKIVILNKQDLPDELKTKVDSHNEKLWLSPDLLRMSNVPVL